MSWFSPDENKIDNILKRAVRPAVLATYHTTSKVLPAYRFVDLYRSIENVTGSDPKRQEIDSQNPEDLWPALRSWYQILRAGQLIVHNPRRSPNLRGFANA